MFLAVIENNKGSLSGGGGTPTAASFQYPFNETVTGELVDIENGVNGVAYNTLIKELGISGFAQYFYKDSYIKIPHNDGFSIEGLFSIDGFVVFTDAVNDGDPNKAYFLFNKRDSETGQREWQLWYSQGTFNFAVFDSNDNFVTYSVPATLNLNQVYHVGVSVNPNVAKSISLWVNKVEGNQPNSGVISLKEPITSNSLTVGQSGWILNNANTSHYGLLDDWKIQKGVAVDQAYIDNRYDTFFANQTDAAVKTDDLKLSLSLKETTGNYLDSANSLQGVFSGTATRGVSGVGGGNGIQFTNAEIRVSHNAVLNLNDGANNLNFAFSLWVNVTKASVNDIWFFNKRDGSNVAYQFTVYQSKIQLYVYNTDGSLWLSELPVSHLPKNQLTHIFAFSDINNPTASKRMAFIINGIFIRPTITGTIKTFKNNTNDFVAGKAAWFDGLQMVGLMDELRIWTGTEVQTGIFSHEFNYETGLST